MAKDPAFLFYSQDFFVGCATLSFEDKGKYIHILCLMHQQGRLDEETIRFSVGNVSVKLKSKFLLDENGFWYNKRLEEEIEKRNNFTKSRRDNGSKGGRPKKEKTDRLLVGLPKDNHMGNEDEDNINTHNTGMGAMPKATDFNGLPETRIGAVIELFRLAKYQEVTKEQVSGLWEVFKIQNLTGKKFYQDADAVYSHFFNWSRGIDITKIPEAKKLTEFQKEMQEKTNQLKNRK